LYSTFGKKGNCYFVNSVLVVVSAPFLTDCSSCSTLLYYLADPIVPLCMLKLGSFEN